ncbi:hypothetical protein MOP88_05135 [Sphingomonas sp. WKB10]|nr:hypothetical protein [Sphingomonas sp. WKB10]
MGSGYNFKQLQAEMLARSQSVDWPQAKSEWDLEDVFIVNQDQVCLCGHHPIRQICTLRNSVIANPAEVGNVCVQKFLGMNSRRVVNALKRISGDIHRSLNKEGIEMFTNLGVISRVDADDYLLFYRKRKNITDRQRSLRASINNKVIKYAAERARRSEEQFRNL